MLTVHQNYLKDYLLSRDISVLSCYVTKSWMRKEERDNVTACRVNVPCEQHDAIIKANIWSKGIVLRDWKFKKSSFQNGTQS